MNIKTIIVDDEPHAREGIRIRLSEYKEINIVAECSSGSEAVSIIDELKPDLLFLDIQMPEMNGFEVLQHIKIAPLPIVIFVTAFDKYALKAFEFHVLDYLLKPINEDRFKDTLKSVLAATNHRNLESYTAKLKGVLNNYLELVGEKGELPPSDQSSTNKNYISRLMIKSKDTISVIPVSDIDWIESAGDYVYVHSSTKKHLFRETLSALELKLDPQKFVRIHRSSIVNIDKLKSLKQNDHGDFDVYLVNGEKLKLSRTFRSHFQEVVGNTL